jgi:hypothetical protein
VFTSGIVSTQAGQTIALFFTGQKHAGENLDRVLPGRRGPRQDGAIAVQCLGQPVL